MSNLWKRSLSMLLAIVMVVGMVPVSVFATEEEASAPTEEIVEIDPAVAEVQGMMDALPTSFASAEAVDAFWTVVEPIDAAIAALTEEQQAQLDYTNYNAAIDAAAAFTNPEFDEAVTYDVSNAAWNGNILEFRDSIGSISKGELFSVLSQKWPDTKTLGTTINLVFLGKYTIALGGYKINGTQLKDKDETGTVTVEDGNTYTVEICTQTNYQRSGTDFYETSTWENAGSFTAKIYHNVTASVDASANAEGAGAVTATGKVYHNEPATISVTDVADYKAELYLGDTLVTTLSDEAGWTYTIEKATASNAYTVKYVSTKATEYPATVEIVNDDWGTASLGTDKGIAGAEIGLAVTPEEDTDSAKYSYTVAVENGSYDASTGKVTVAGTGDVTVTVTFAKYAIEKNASIGEVKFNTKKSVTDQLDKLKEYIFTAVVNSGESLPNDISWDELDYEYIPWYKGDASGDYKHSYDGLVIGAGKFDETPHDLTATPTDRTAHTGYTFGARFADTEDTAEGNNTEKIILTGKEGTEWADLKVKATITLIEAREAAVINYKKPATVEFETEAEIIAAVLGGCTTNGGAMSAVRKSGDLPDGGNSATLIYTVTAQENEEALIGTKDVEIDVKAKVNPATVNISVVGDGAVTFGTLEQSDTLVAGNYTLTATPENWDTEYNYVASVTVNGTELTNGTENFANGVFTYADYTIANAETYNIVVTFAKRVLNVQDVEFKVNGYSNETRKASYVAALTAANVAAGSTQGGVAVTDFSQMTVKALCNVILGSDYLAISEMWDNHTDMTGNRALQITWAGDARYPTIVSEGVVYAKPQGESREELVLSDVQTNTVKIDSFDKDEDSIKNAALEILKEDSNYPTTEPTVSSAVVANGENNTATVTVTFNATSAYVDNTAVVVTVPYEIKTYTVTWYNEDGTTVLDTQTLAYGSTPEYKGEKTVAELTAAKNDAQYTWSFAGWTANDKVAEDGTITGAAIYTASYTSKVNQYTVKFWNDADGDGEEDDGEIISSKAYDYGTAADGIEKPADPTRESSDTTVYTFSGWGEIAAVTDNVTYKAQYTESTRYYTVTFYDEDGTTVLQTVEGLKYNDVPKYTENLPEKDADDTYTYEFKSWDKEIAAVTADGMSYNATYTPTFINYTIKWTVDGKVYQEKTDYHYNDTLVEPETNPTKAADEDYTYIFKGWDYDNSGDVEVGEAKPETVTANAEYKAIFSNKSLYDVTVVYDNGTGDATGKVEDGGTFTLPETPNKTGYTFLGWYVGENKVEGTITITADTTIKAKWQINSYNYTIKTYEMGLDGEYGEPATETKSAEYGAPVSVIPEAKEGFTVADTSVLSGTIPANDDLVLKVYYSRNQYKITWNNGDGDAEETYYYGADITAPIATKSAKKDANGNVMATYTNGTWGDDVPTNMPAGDLEFTATFTEVPAQYTVTWVVDGNTTPETYYYGATPSFKGSTVKATVNYVQYTFADWDPAIGEVTGDVTYTAKYNAELLANNGAFEINKYYEEHLNMDEIIKTLKADVLNAAGLPGANAANYKVEMKYTLGTLDLDKLSGWSNALNATAFFTAIELPESGRQFVITDNATGISKTVTMAITDSRDVLPAVPNVTEQKDLGYMTNDNILEDVKATVGELTLDTPAISAGALPVNAGDETSVTYTVKFNGDATYQPKDITITYEKVYKGYNDCTVIEGGEYADLGSVKVNGTAADSTAVTVPGKSKVTVEVTPNTGYAVEAITVTKNGVTLATFETTDITYSNAKATVYFTSDGATAKDKYVVSATYSEAKLVLKDGQTIVYCIDNDESADLQELVFNAVYGESNPALTKDNVTIEFKSGYTDLSWKGLNEAPTLALTGHKFGEDGSETIRVTYEDKKYGKLQETVELNVFDSCYSVTVGVQTEGPENAKIKTQYSLEARKYLDVEYFKQGEKLTVTLTPDGDILNSIGTMYNGNFQESMAYIESVTVTDKAGNVVAAEMTRGQGELSLDSFVGGVNPMLFNAKVSFTLAADENYTVTVKYGVLKLEQEQTALTLPMYQGVVGKYDAVVPSAEELIDAILGADYADNFIATHGGAYTVEYSTVLSESVATFSAVSADALLALSDDQTILVRITWKPGDTSMTYYPVAVKAQVTLKDNRTVTAVKGAVPEKQVNFINEDKLIEELKTDMGLGITANNVDLNVNYTVSFTMKGNAEDGLFADVTVTYDGSTEYKPTSRTFENVPIANRPDDATVKVTISNATAVVTNNDGKIQNVDPVTGIYTVIGNGTYNFKFTPVSGYAIESVTVNGETVELTYDKSVASFSKMLEEEGVYEVVVETVESKWVLEDSRVYNFAYGLDTPVNADIVDAAVAAPTDIDYADVKIEYLARAEGKVTVDLSDIDMGFAILPLEPFEIDMGELWLDPTAEVEMVDQHDLQKIVEDLVKEVMYKFSMGELNAQNALDYLIGKVKSQAIGIHAFGVNGDGSTETIRISYSDNKYTLAETRTDVTIHDYRTPTEINAVDCEVTFGYSLAQLIAASGAQVMANGAAVEGLAIETKDLYLHANSDAQQIRLTFAGDATYQPSEVTINVIVNKATCEIDYDSQIVTYGDDYDFSLHVSPTVMPDGTNPEIDRIEFFIGLEMDKILDVDIEDKDVGLGSAVSFIQLRLPETIRELPLVGKYLEGEFSLGEFVDLVNGLSGELGIDAGSVDSLNQVLEAITGITENLEIKVKVVSEEFHPETIGVYIAGAVTVDADFETAYTADYLIVKPATYECTLDWDYNDENQIMTLPAYQTYYKDMMGAHVVENDILTGDLLTKANENVKYLFLGVNNDESDFLYTDIYGNIKANIYTSADAINDNGAYVEIAYMLNWNNEIFYAVPIVRSFVIVPQTVDVQFVDETGAENNDRLLTYNGTSQGMDVLVTKVDGTVAVDTLNGLTSENLTVYYVGVQTNGKAYNDSVAPEHAGVYTALATYVEYEGDELKYIGAAAGLLVIQPSESSIDVGNDLYIYDGNEYALNKLILDVDSLNSDKTPDITVISAAIADTGDFSEQGWDAVEGSVNVDFPKWVDELIAVYAPSVVDGITVSQLQEKLLNKLPDISDKLLELGASQEIVDSLAGVLADATEVLNTLPGDMTLSFKDNATGKDIGVYLVMGVVTDSDHYPSMDSGILVIAPDHVEVELKYDQDPNGNNIFTPELLKDFDLGAKAYDLTTGEEIPAATGSVINLFVGVNAKGEAVFTDDATTLDNGIYTEYSFMQDLSANMYYAKPISRVIVLAANPAKVTLVDETGAENDERLFRFDNTQKSMDAQVVINDSIIVPEDGDLVITYTGAMSNGKNYHSTTAPKNAGTYIVTAVYSDYDENGKLVSYGTDIGMMVILPATSDLEVTGGTVVYDGQGHTVDVAVTGGGNAKPDYTMISGGVHVSGNINEVGVDAFHSNVNIDFPAWIDEVLRPELEAYDEGVDVAWLKDFVDSHRNNIISNIPVEKLIELGADQTKLDEAIAAVNDYVDQMIQVIDALPDNVSLTFEDNKTYTLPGNYYYYAMVTDSDHYTSVGTGLLVIEKAPLTFDLLDTTRTYNAAEQFVELNNPQNSDYFAIIADRDDKIFNILMDEDLLTLKDLLAEKLGVEIPNTIDIAELHEKMPVETIAAAIDEIIGATEALELPDYAVKILEAVKAELQSLPAEGTITINGALPVNVGEYEIYAVTYSDLYQTEVSEGVLVIEPMELEITVQNATKVYGQADPAFTYEITKGELMNGDELTVSFDREDGENVGTYAINATVAEDPNYKVTVIAGELEITPADLTITLEDKSKVYGEADPALTYVVSGLVNGDAETALNIAASRTEGEDVGTYAITATAANANYNITVVEGKLTITKADLEVTVDNQTKVYGDADPELTYVVSGLVNGDAEKVLGISIRRKAGENVGTYAITAAAANANYNIFITSGKLTITPATVTITLADQTKVYGENDPTWTWTVEGLKLEDTEAALNIAASRTEGEDVGTYAITATAANANYNITVVDGKLTITKANVVITIVSDEMTYGEAVPAVELSYSNEKAKKDGVVPTITWAVSETPDVGTYTASIQLVFNKNWTVTYVGGKLTVNPAPIESVEVTGEYVYDTTEQTVAVVVKDSKGNVLVEGKDYTVSGNKATNAGTYAVTVEGMGNYAGTLTADWTIAKAEIVVVADDKTMGLNDEQIPELTFKVVEGAVSVEELNNAVTLTTDPEMNTEGQYVAGEYEIAITVADGDNWIVKEAKAGKLTVTIPADFICWNTATKVYYNDVTDGLEEAKEVVDQYDEVVVQMLKDATAAFNQKDEFVIVVHNGLTFDLNGYYVETDNMLSYGVVLDTATGADSVIADGNIATGGIVISNDTRVAFTQLQPENGGYLPIYDTNTGSYKFYEFAMNSVDITEGTASSCKFRFRIDFTSHEAYGVLANTTDSAFDIVLDMSWPGTTNFGITYVMSAATVKGWANAQYGNAAAEYKMTLIVRGLDNLPSGIISAVPAVVAQSGVTDSDEALEYEY